MTKTIARATLLSLALLLCWPPARASLAQAPPAPLRSGTVFAKIDAGLFTYFKVIDKAGKEFWVLTSVCTIGDKGKIDVLAGTHYDRMRSEHLKSVLEDVYVAQLLRIGGQQVGGLGAHDLPAGCLVLK